MILVSCGVFIELFKQASSIDPFGLGSEQALVGHDAFSHLSCFESEEKGILPVVVGDFTLIRGGIQRGEVQRRGDADAADSGTGYRRQ